MQDQQEEGVESLVCPSFNSYSTDEVAHIAERVRREQLVGVGPQNDALGSDFEFVTFRKAADGVFFDGSVGPVFPVFNRDLLTTEDGSGGRSGGRDATAEEDASALQFPLRKLLIGDEDQERGGDRDPPSSSSSEADDLEAIPPGTYCVWTPKSAKATPGRCKKSNSTGSSSSKKWKLLDLLRRSNSDGKESFVFLTPSSSGSGLAKKEGRAENSKEQWSSGSTESGKVVGKPKAKGSGISGDGGERKVSAHEAFYVRNRELKKVDKRKSYLPYRQDLVGFFASVNGMGKAFRPF